MSAYQSPGFQPEWTEWNEMSTGHVGFMNKSNEHRYSWTGTSWGKSEMGEMMAKYSFLNWSQARAMGFTAVLLGKVLDHKESLRLFYSLPIGKSLQERFALREGVLCA